MPTDFKTRLESCWKRAKLIRAAKSLPPKPERERILLDTFEKLRLAAEEDSSTPGFVSDSPTWLLMGLYGLARLSGNPKVIGWLPEESWRVLRK